MNDFRQLNDIANGLRRDVLKMTTDAGGGHLTSCLSCAEIMSALFFQEMTYDVKNAKNPDNDEFILSKGHAAPILYSSLFRAGCIKTDLMKLRKFGSPLEGHPIPRNFDWIKVATGSLGQGLSIGAGMALAGKMQKRNFRVYVLMGDSEVSEGSVYEAFRFASYYKLNNLCTIVDLNKLGQRGETMEGYNTESYIRRFAALGWDVSVIDGHDTMQITSAFGRARKSDKPFVIIARTVKGKGISFLEGKNGWHGKALNKNEMKKALNEIPEVKMPKIKIEKPKKTKFAEINGGKIKLKRYKVDEEIATREAYGDFLATLVKAESKAVVLDAEVGNSTFAEKAKDAMPERFVECFIAEQNMIGISLGLSIKGFRVFASTFAAFLTRAHDQLRMASLSSISLNVCGSHSGVSIGEDGASQMGLDDIAMFRAFPNSAIFYPSDAVSCSHILANSLQKKGLNYIRTTRAKTPVIYDGKENFPIGEFKVLRESEEDEVVLAGAGITLHEALKAYFILLKNKIKSSVVDLYCVKPFNKKKFVNFIKAHGGKIVVVEDHYAEGGIGEMIAEVVENEDIKIKHLAVREMPHSGKPEELLKKYEINADAIVRAAKELTK